MIYLDKSYDIPQYDISQKNKRKYENKQNNKRQQNTINPGNTQRPKKIYEWCYQSETTKYHSGPPNFPNNPIQTYEDFFSSDNGGYTDYFFTGAKPEDGRGYIILNNDEPIGFISYTAFHLKPGIAEMDLWMGADANCGNGFGTDALISLGNYLNKEMGISKLIIAPSAKNKRAVRSYEKSGFKKTDKPMSDFLLDEYVDDFGDGDYGEDETSILVKEFQ